MDEDINNDVAAKQIERAHRARVIMDDPLVREAFAALEESWVRQFKGTPKEPPTDADLRQTWMCMQLTGTLKDWFAAVLANGEVAIRKLERDLREAKMAERGDRLVV